MAKQYKNYVNGEWKTSENSITIYAPANGEELGSVPAMSQAEVDEVYAAAKAALPAWRALSYAERAAYLHKAADILERDADKIGQVLSKEISKGLKSAIGEVVRTAEIIHYAAEEVCVWKVKYLKVVPLMLVAREKSLLFVVNQ